MILACCLLKILYKFLVPLFQVKRHSFFQVFIFSQLLKQQDCCHVFGSRLLSNRFLQRSYQHRAFLRAFQCRNTQIFSDNNVKNKINNDLPECANNFGFSCTCINRFKDLLISNSRFSCFLVHFFNKFI